LEGREWGKPQARCSGRQSDDDPARQKPRAVTITTAQITNEEIELLHQKILQLRFNAQSDGGRGPSISVLGEARCFA
jgi:hypothetical protein